MMHRTMRAWAVAAALTYGVAGTVPLHAQDVGHDSVLARSRTGKRLFGSSDALRVARVFSPRLSPDGSRVAYLVAVLLVITLLLFREDTRNRLILLTGRGRLTVTTHALDEAGRRHVLRQPAPE